MLSNAWKRDVRILLQVLQLPPHLWVRQEPPPALPLTLRQALEQADTATLMAVLIETLDRLHRRA